MSIKHISFKHGWFYHYRLHTIKIDNLCQGNLVKLKDYLDFVFQDCPHDYFLDGPRGSSLKFNICAEPIEIKGHEVSMLADAGLSTGSYKTAHSNVQIYMLQNDTKTLAVEVPLWLKPEEHEIYSKYFDSENPLTGHIDVLRVEDNKIWIWDFKPNANKEKFAKTQVFFYALMLSKRTEIPLSNFRCGYFDENLAYVFEPDIVIQNEL